MSNLSLGDIRRLGKNEGWSLFDIGDTGLTLQRSGDRLQTREQAFDIVLERAASGSPHHLDALLCLSSRNRVEYALILANASAHQRLLLIDQGLPPFDPTLLPEML